MSKREWMPITIAVLGITLIVDGAFSFSKAGWEMMKPDYGGMCDADDLYGSDVTGELFSRGEAATIADQYLATYRNADFEIAEVMEFENNFHVQAQGRGPVASR